MKQLNLLLFVFLLSILSCDSENELYETNSLKNSSRSINSKKIEIIGEYPITVFPYDLNNSIEKSLCGLTSGGSVTGFFQTILGDYFKNDMNSQYYTGINNSNIICGFSGISSTPLSEGNYLIFSENNKIFLPIKEENPNWYLFESKAINDENNVILSSRYDDNNSYYYDFSENKLTNISIPNTISRYAVDINNNNDILILTENNPYIYNDGYFEEIEIDYPLYSLGSMNIHKDFVGTLIKNGIRKPFMYNYSTKELNILETITEAYPSNPNFSSFYIRHINDNKYISGGGTEISTHKEYPLFWNYEQENITFTITEIIRNSNEYTYIDFVNFSGLNNNNELAINVLDNSFNSKTILLKLNE